MEEINFEGTLIISTHISEIVKFKSNDEELIKSIASDLKLIKENELDFIVINMVVYGRDFLKGCKIELYIMTK